MKRHVVKAAAGVLALIIVLLIVWNAIDVFLIGFAAILLAILLNTIGHGTKRIIPLPYLFSLIIAMCSILGLFLLIFWLYTPLISDQFRLLLQQLPGAVEIVKSHVTPYFNHFLSNETVQRHLSATSEKLFNQLFTLFSFTIGSLINFIVFLIVGLYLALSPNRYINWVLFFIPARRVKRGAEIMNKIGQTLRWWLLGKCLAMVVIGVTTFIGLRLLNVSLAFILGLLSALFTFIPYVGAIISAIPAVLIAFTQSPLLSLYVIFLYLGIHLIEGYMITPFIEQKTVSIPPAITILIQVLMLTLVGVVGFALATPLAVLAIALIRYSRKPSQVEK